MKISDINKDGAKFYVDDSGTLQRVEMHSECESVYIPHKLEDGTEIRNIAAGSCSGHYDEIIISDEICNIDDMAFSKSKVRSVVWSKGCTRIPDGCFEDSSICSITNIDEVEVVGERAFDGSELTSIKWPSKCGHIPKLCFANTFSLEDISNIEHVTRIDYGAFACSGLAHFVWPSKCTEVPVSCFEGGYLVEIEGLDNVTAAGELAFANCLIESFVIPRSLKVIPDGFLRDNISLTRVDCHNEVLEIGLCAFASTGIESFKWPLKCKIVPESCFLGCGSLEELHNISEVFEIQFGAFRNCRSLKQFTWPGDCKDIPDACFTNSGLEKISNLKNIVSIGDCAFSNTNIQKLDLSSTSILSIGDGAFGYLDKNSVSLPYYAKAEGSERWFMEIVAF